MGRAKLRLELIQDEKARRRAYESRIKGLTKKADELSTLCGVDLCMIHYLPASANGAVTVWPENKKDLVDGMIASYKISRSSGEGRARNYNLTSFFNDRIGKTEEDVKKLRKKNLESKYANWNERCNRMSREELNALAGVLTERIDAATALIHSRKKRARIAIDDQQPKFLTTAIQENAANFPVPMMMLPASDNQGSLAPYFVETMNTGVNNQYCIRSTTCCCCTDHHHHQIRGHGYLPAPGIDQNWGGFNGTLDMSGGGSNILRLDDQNGGHGYLPAPGIDRNWGFNRTQNMNGGGNNILPLDHQDEGQGFLPAPGIDQNWGFNGILNMSGGGNSILQLDYQASSSRSDNGISNNFPTYVETNQL